MSGFTGLPVTLTRTITGADTIVPADRNKTLLLSNSSAFTLAATAAATLGSSFGCRVRNISAAIHTINPNASELINSQLTFPLLPGQDGTLVCDGAAFYLLGVQNEVVTYLTAAAAAELVVPLPDGFASHEIIIHALMPASDAQVHMTGSVDGGSSYIATNYVNIRDRVSPAAVASPAGSTSDSKIILSASQESTGTVPMCAKIDILNPLDTGHQKRVSFDSSWFDATNAYVEQICGTSAINSTSRLTHIKIFCPAVDITDARVTLRSKA